ncbi:hypothetical protein Tdes44962_MAKER03209 [Teratosphaeria destructans]|uniref:Uncharacterized protein n=1 Tax=Teratosphaeria destructans TaxID=418781 RepID=A0A9W7SRG7_9PEZI|nr:hypothetical protein Tdes44962_MAKER03209 [Teratosphaeria destructans]
MAIQEQQGASEQCVQRATQVPIMSPAGLPYGRSPQRDVLHESGADRAASDVVQQPELSRRAPTEVQAEAEVGKRGKYHEDTAVKRRCWPRQPICLDAWGKTSSDKHVQPQHEIRELREPFLRRVSYSSLDGREDSPRRDGGEQHEHSGQGSPAREQEELGSKSSSIVPELQPRTSRQYGQTRIDHAPSLQPSTDNENQDEEQQEPSRFRDLWFRRKSKPKQEARHRSDSSGDSVNTDQQPRIGNGAVPDAGVPEAHEHISDLHLQGRRPDQLPSTSGETDRVSIAESASRFVHPQTWMLWRRHQSGKADEDACGLNSQERILEHDVPATHQPKEAARPPDAAYVVEPAAEGVKADHGRSPNAGSIEHNHVGVTGATPAPELDLCSPAPTAVSKIRKRLRAMHHLQRAVDSFRGTKKSFDTF